MSRTPFVSLCIPTNGVTEWVFPVLESIYKQNVDTELFEIVITDNGNNEGFKRKLKEFQYNHDNLKYVETNALPFLNEIESYRNASGILMKFVNHRTLLIDGFLEKLVEISKKYTSEKPIIYYSNGNLEIAESIHVYDRFDQFVSALSYYSSWSTGMTIWKEDFNKIENSIYTFNELFPHTDILFFERKRTKYIIDNSVVFNELPQGAKPKGRYDVFYAFGVEYPSIILNLLRSGDISLSTFRKIKDENLGFVSKLYYSYCVRNNYTSYDISGLKGMFGIFYSKPELLLKTTSVISTLKIHSIFKR